jgi:hypothetical protein
MNQLRPLSIGEVLDVAFKLYFRHWARFAATVAIIVIPIQLIDAVIRLSTIDAVDGKVLIYGDKAAYTTGAVVISLLGGLLSLFVAGAAFRAVSEAYMGHDPSIKASLRFALTRVFPLLWLYILLGLGVLLGFICLVIPGIILYVLWAVAVPALMVEGLRGTKALGRSRELVSGRWWQTFAVLLVALVVIQVSTGAIVALGSSLIIRHTTSLTTYVVVQGLLTGIVEILVLPLTVAVTVVLYFDLRVRKEGFDVSQMIDTLGLRGADDVATAGAGIAGLPASGTVYPPPPAYPAPSAPATSGWAPPTSQPPAPPPSGPPSVPSGWAPPIAPDVAPPPPPPGEPGTE